VTAALADCTHPAARRSAQPHAATNLCARARAACDGAHGEAGRVPRGAANARRSARVTAAGGRDAEGLGRRRWGAGRQGMSET
jgi:hypothetical protein